VTANGAPPPTFSFTGTLPSGVNLSAAGVLSGTPAAGTGGTYPITITASNGIAPNAPQSFTLTVNQPPAITSANSTTFTVGTNGNFQLTASGFPTTFTFTNTGNALPSGVTLSASGLLSGTPAAATGGVYNLTFQVSNGVSPVGTQSFTLTVNQAPAITSTNSTTFTVGTNGNFQLTASGFPTSMTFTNTGNALPSGVTLSGAGVLSGIPGAGTGGVYNLTFQASNGVAPAATQSFTLTVNQVPAFSSAASTTFTVGTNGNFNVTASGFPSPAITLQSGVVPNNVLFTPGTGTATLAGTPATGTGGMYDLVFNANNGVSRPSFSKFLPDGTVVGVTQNFTLTVNEAPSITSANSTTFTEGNFGSFNVVATGFPAPTMSATGTLPNAVTFVNGLLSGTPDAGTAAAYPIQITATNGVGSNAQQSFTLNVTAAVCTAPPAGMISWWAANGNALDLLGAHTGTLMAGATANIPGKVGQAFTLNGTTDYVSIAGGAILAGQAAFTVDAWFKTTTSFGFGPIYSESHTTDATPFLYTGLLNGKLHFTARGTGATMAITSTLSYNDGLFHLAAFVKHADNSWELFVDGQSIGTSTTAVGTLTLNRSEIGRFTQGAGSGVFYAGQIDEVELFSNALSQPQIQALYDASIAGKCRPALQLSSAVSRKTHGAAGTFDVPLPLTGEPGVECRTGGGGGNHTLVFTFSNGISSGTATLTSGTGTVSGTPTFSGNTMSVDLTGVTNIQQITVELSAVTDAVGQVLPDAFVSMNVLLGDTTGNKAVNASDIAQTKGQSGAPVNGTVDASNFRNDVTVDGSINASDISQVKAAAGTGLP
jgi:hypothetical protein